MDHTNIPDSILQRKGARTTRDVPREVRALLDAGRIETVNLCEWLVVDQTRLAEVVFAKHDWIAHLPEVGRALEANSQRTTLKDMVAIGGVLASAFGGKRQFAKPYRALISHPSDVVRSWGAYLVGKCDSLRLSERLERIRPLAADRNMGVREAAWMAVREHLTAELETAIALLAEWSLDDDPNIRRFASESTRPRGVWCRHIERLKQEPELGLPILAPLKADPAKYVQDSVGNWLNDASKSQPDWVREVCARWRKESKCKETERILKRGLRTIGD
ncbi:MAG: DNA alkylation repair protein [Planctomycetia bacterium]|nr:DNA alkylation repair protein [Planctomycetia bacterium]